MRAVMLCHSAKLCLGRLECFVACESPRSSHAPRHASDTWLSRGDKSTHGRSRSRTVSCDLKMSSSDQNPAATPASGGAEPAPPGRLTAVSSRVLDMGAQMVQALKPVQQMKLHACSFALYAHDLRRQMEVHHFLSRLNQDVVQCAVYDSDKPSARLIGARRRRRLFPCLPLQNIDRINLIRCEL